MNPGDLNAKSLSGERRRFLGRLIGLFMAGLDEITDDSELRRVRHSNRVARQQCVRLIEIATATLGVFTQLKGCSSMPRAEVPIESFEKETAWLMVADAMDGLMTSTFHGCVMMAAMVCKAFICMLGLSVLVAGVTFLFLGPLTWNYSRRTWWFERRFSPMTMGWRHRLFMYPSLQVSRWLLGREVGYLHECFRAARQQGDMMVDLEGIYADLCKHLGGERVRLDEPRDPINVPMGEANAGDEGANTEGGEEEPGDDDPPDGGDDPNVDDPNGDEIVHMAINGIPLNGLTVDRTDVHPGLHPEPEAEDGSDDDMGAETAEERRRRYLASSQYEVSVPHEWANLQYGHLNNDAYDRMLAYSTANRIRLRRAVATLTRRHDEAARLEIGRKQQRYCVHCMRLRPSWISLEAISACGGSW